ncbi:DMT family transporter [Nocardioides aequoreus]|uniref:DMT family transporter n=1 Tax=Nocardioides aequoreus TaxID=397278 RepID=UPI00056B898F|nr:DMT family transporter [Nocardioides aequoreus]
MPERRWLPLAAVATTLVLWASAFVAVRHLGHDFSPGALSLGRLLVGSVALALVVLPQGLPRPSRRQWSAIVAIGLLWYAVYNVALNAGELWVDAGTAAMLIQVAPVLIAVMAALFLDEPFTRTLGLGLVLAFGGVALIGLSTGSREGTEWYGVVLVLVSAAAYAVSVVLQKPLMGSLPAVQVTWLACTVGAVACLPFAPQLLDEVRAAPASSTWWVVYLGLFPTALAFTTYAYALRHMSASSLGVTTYLVPPITIVMGLLLLGEVPPSLAYVGGVLALVGVAVARRRPREAAAVPSRRSAVGR